MTALTAPGFGAGRVCQVVGITPRKLDTWDTEWGASPTVTPRAGIGHHRRWGYDDLMILAVVKLITEDTARCHGARLLPITQAAIACLRAHPVHSLHASVLAHAFNTWWVLREGAELDNAIRTIIAAGVPLRLIRLGLVLAKLDAALAPWPDPAALRAAWDR